MDITVKNSFSGGSVSAIPSKSYAHRAIICAALSDKKTEIICGALSDDIIATLNCVKALGAGVEMTQNGFILTPFEKAEKRAELCCGESGSTYRFMLPVCCALGVEADIVLEGRLPYRPMTQLFSVLMQNGIDIDDGVKEKIHIRGKLENSCYYLPGNTSSQFITGMMLSLPLIAKCGTINITEGLESKGYIEITADVMRAFGVEVDIKDSVITVKSENGYVSYGSVKVEGDWSNAAFPLVMAAVTEKEVTLENISFCSSQGDKEILNVLKSFGAIVEIKEKSVTAKGGGLKGMEINCADIPDMVPAIAVLASVAKGTTRINSIKRLKIKESDRIKAITQTLLAIGADISSDENSITVIGKKRLLGGEVHSFSDHRIVMMAACAAQICENDVIIKDAQAVNKSYPLFFEDMEKLGMRFEKKEDIS